MAHGIRQGLGDRQERHRQPDDGCSGIQGRGIFEGLYIAAPETYVLTRTSQQAITIRSGEFLELLRNAILAQELVRFYGRKDEICIIAQTIHDVCGYLRKTV